MTRQTETIKTERELEDDSRPRKSNENLSGPVLFQTSPKYRQACRFFGRHAARRLFVVDVYIANVLYELRQLGNKIPYPSTEYPYIRVFFPWRLTNRVFKQYGEEYATRFSNVSNIEISIKKRQGKIVMAVRASMKDDLKIAGIENGLFIYSMWNGYRSMITSMISKLFDSIGFQNNRSTYEWTRKSHRHTKGHIGTCTENDRPDTPMSPELFVNMADNVELKEDKIAFTI